MGHAPAEARGPPEEAPKRPTQREAHAQAIRHGFGSTSAEVSHAIEEGRNDMAFVKQREDFEDFAYEVVRTSRLK